MWIPISVGHRVFAINERLRQRTWQPPNKRTTHHRPSREQKRCASPNMKNLFHPHRSCEFRNLAIKRRGKLHHKKCGRDSWLLQSQSKFKYFLGKHTTCVPNEYQARKLNDLWPNRLPMAQYAAHYWWHLRHLASRQRAEKQSTNTS